MHQRRLEEAATRLRDWACQRALPLWASRGFDRSRQRFEERLTSSGEPIRDVPIRLIVQARQIYSFALAARRGWHAEASTLVERAHASMVRDYRRGDGAAGWAFSIRRDGAVADAGRDLYAHAFVLLAAASCVAMTGRRETLALADETLAYIDGNLRAPDGLGFLEGSPASGALRRQNPHMHLLEGLLSLWSASGRGAYLERAHAIFDLFRTRFFQPDLGVLGEYFDERLGPAGGLAGQIVEPGHHYEWIWLLRWFERETGSDVGQYVDALYAHADRFGFDGNGLIVDELLADGSVRAGSHRIWPMTEAIKANLVEGAAGRPGATARAAALAYVLRDRFLTENGGWIDRLDEAGAPAADFMPASTLYHLVCAIDELDRLVLRQAQGPRGDTT